MLLACQSRNKCYNTAYTFLSNFLSSVTENTWMSVCVCVYGKEISVSLKQCDPPHLPCACVCEHFVC